MSGLDRASIKVAIEGDSSGFNKAADDAQKKVNDLTGGITVSNEEALQFVRTLEQLAKVKAFDDLARSLKKNQEDMAAAKQRARELAAEYRETGSRLAELGAEEAKEKVKALSSVIKEQVAALRAESDALKRAGIDTKNLSAEEKRLSDSLKGQEDAFDAIAKKEKEVAENARLLEEAIAKAAKKKDAVNELATAFGGLQTVKEVTSKVVDGVKSFAAFDDALRETKAAAGLTEAQLESLKEKAIELGKSPGLTATDIAQGMAESARAGQDYNEILASVAANAQLAQGSELGFAESVEHTSNILGQFGKGAEDTQKIVDILIAGANNASVKVGQVAQAYSYAGAVSNSFGASISTVAAQFLVLANSSLKAERGGTSLTSIWDALLTKKDKFKELFNIDVTEMVNGEEKVRSLADIIDELSVSGMTASQRVELFGQTAGPGIAVFMEKGGKAIRDYEKQLESAAGSGDRVAKTLQEGIGGEGVRKVTSSMEILVLQLVDSLEPALKAAGSTLGDFLLFLSDLPKPVLASVAAAGALATAAIGVAGAMSAWNLAGPGLVANLVVIKGALTSTAVASSGLLISMGQLAVVAASLAAVYKAVGAYNEMRDAQDMAAESARNAAEQEKKYQDRLKAASEAAGYQIDSYKGVQEAYRKGIIDYDALTDTYSKGSGIAREAAEDSKDAAESQREVFRFTAEQAEDSADKTNLSAKQQKKALEELKKEYEDLTREIEKINDALTKLADEGAADQLELANAARAPIDAWNSQKQAALDLGPALAAAKAEADRLAAAGDIAGANKSYERAVELGRQMRDGFKELATEVKAEFTPAMEESLDAAKEAAKDFSEQYKEAMKDANDANKELVDTTKSLVAAEKDLASFQRDRMREGLSAIDVYRDITAEQKELEAASRAAAEAGDYDLAIEKAREAKQVASELNHEVKNGEQVVVSAEDARRKAYEAGVSARQLEIEALKQKQAFEQAAQDEAIERANRLAAAEEEEKARAAELQAQKEQILKSEAEAAQEAAELEKQARQQITDVLIAQQEMLKQIADQKNEESGWTLGDAYTEAGEEAKALFESNAEIAAQMKNIPADAIIDWGSAWKTIEADGAAAADAVNAKWDNAAKDRYITMYVREVTQRAAGGFAGPVQALASRYVTGGAGKTDGFGPVMLDYHEFVLKKDAVHSQSLGADGPSLAWAHNRQDWSGMLAILSKHLGVSPFEIEIPLAPVSSVETHPAYDDKNYKVLVLDDRATGQRAVVSGKSVDLDAIEKMMRHRRIVRSR